MEHVWRDGSGNEDERVWLESGVFGDEGFDGLGDGVTFDVWVQLLQQTTALLSAEGTKAILVEEEVDT